MKKRSHVLVFGKLLAMVTSLWGYMILAVSMGVVGHLCAISITVLGAYGLLHLLGFQASFSLLTIFTFLVIAALLRAVLHYGEQALNHYIAFKLLALIRDKLFMALRKLAPAKLEGKDKGNLIALITSDIELLEVFYAHTISPILIALILALVLCFFLGGIHLFMAILALFSYGMIGIVIPVIAAKLSGERAMDFRNISGDFSSFVLDSLRGLTEILQFGRGEKRLDDMDAWTDAIAVEEKKLKDREGIITAITQFVIYFCDALMLLTASLLLLHGKIQWHEALIAIIAFMSSFGPFIALANLGFGLQKTLSAANRVFNILEEEPLTKDIVGKEPCEFQGVEIQNISFSYEEEPIFKNFSMEKNHQQIVGILGKSGSGKSTLLRLLMRFWDVDEGSLKIAERDLRDINTSNLRDMESFVTQETHLFHDSILNNIRIAKLQACDEEIYEACKKASIHNFIENLPEGYDTPVGELGDKLSGGERQRIGLARAFLHDAPCLLLDEPTSNIDSLNEAIILKAIDEQKTQKTIFLVSHRKSTLGITDKVYHVQQGRIS